MPNGQGATQKVDVKGRVAKDAKTAAIVEGRAKKLPSFQSCVSNKDIIVLSIYCFIVHFRFPAI